MKKVTVIRLGESEANGPWMQVEYLVKGFKVRKFVAPETLEGYTEGQVIEVPIEALS
ncbi:MAG: hypothetical protein GY775_19455 [Candidatus Scalindua sp.]|nr:hypothetical protein [Candidatus Scalindua sp.]